ncbi:cupin domain-containing protein [Psychrobacter lutiphocae]|uniref:hypothetical protein n=1 Tax=Psychrobacter lutiphocae TaxID=540500 RepID=UPI00035F1131|nr:hypothetical protein [Psychrobacter lutiphocae]
MDIYTTKLGSLNNYEKGSIQIIKGAKTDYAFSNIFEVAANAQPYEKTIVGKNLKFIIESVRAEGQSPWYTASHDEFVIAMDGEVRVDFLKLNEDAVIPEEQEGTHLAGEQPDGKVMGYVLLKQGHQAILPAGSAYRFEASKPSVILIQTIQGPLSIEKWNDICFT